MKFCIDRITDRKLNVCITCSSGDHSTNRRVERYLREHCTLYNILSSTARRVVTSSPVILLFGLGDDDATKRGVASCNKSKFLHSLVE